MERKVFTRLAGDNPRSLNDALTHAGFRRSQGIAYKPACEQCHACVSVRIPVAHVTPSRWMRRISRRNDDLVAEIVSAMATEEQYALLKRYLDARHAGGGMADMDAFEYAVMVEDSPVETHLVEYRNKAGDLVGACLTDVLSDGLSLVYSFFDPDLPERSLGSHMVLSQIDLARSLGLEFVYLGYWIEGCRKMVYKGRFRPLEGLGPEGWQVIDPTRLDANA